MIDGLKESDLDEVLKIEQLCFQAPWSKEQFLYELHDNEFSYLYILKENNEIIGFIDYWITFESCQLNQIAVRLDMQGQGFSKQLMRHMIEHAEKEHCASISLEVRVHNEKARNLYESFGFLQVNIRKGYYHDNNEDAYVMVMPLGGNW